MSNFQAGDVLMYNKLWKLGQHYCFDFFKVSHITAKNNVMGSYLSSTRTNEHFDFNESVDLWIVDTSSLSKKTRLPHPGLWHKMSNEEISNGVRKSSCVN